MNRYVIMLMAKQVRTRYGNVIDMALWPWLRDEHLAFPKPVYINGRRYWKPSEREAWELCHPQKRRAA